MIKKLTLATFLLSLLTLAAAAQTPTAPTTHLKIGDTAPDFELNDTGGKPVKLSDFRGKKNVVLAFYVLAFTGG
ncbi:MAG: redoxin domain-containing protein [Blastocatellia bacterium]|nr:redoxin domain-containing protein [Blastocatellia bacterium]